MVAPVRPDHKFTDVAVLRIFVGFGKVVVGGIRVAMLKNNFRELDDPIDGVVVSTTVKTMDQEFPLQDAKPADDEELKAFETESRDKEDEKENTPDNQAEHESGGETPRDMNGSTKRPADPDVDLDDAPSFKRRAIEKSTRVEEHVRKQLRGKQQPPTAYGDKRPRVALACRWGASGGRGPDVSQLYNGTCWICFRPEANGICDLCGQAAAYLELDLAAGHQAKAALVATDEGQNVLAK